MFRGKALGARICPGVSKDKSKNCKKKSGFLQKSVTNARILVNLRAPHQMIRQHALIFACLPLFFLILAGFAACSKSTGHVANAEVDYWTCAMHPSVHSKTPGKGPICGMDLAPLRQPTRTNDNERQRATTVRHLPAGNELSREDYAPPPSEHAFLAPVPRQQLIG